MRKPATSPNASQALNMLSKAQQYFVEQLSQLCQQSQLPDQFVAVQWLRDQGKHGGGLRYQAPQVSLFNQASVNISQIQFEDTPSKAFISATALSTIIHPEHPLIPSVHIHVSWTELRSGKSYWRLMADLNPAVPCDQDANSFSNDLKNITGEYFTQGSEQGDHYFYIPALKTHRGVSHFYLEGFNPQQEDGHDFAKQFVYTTINSYINIFKKKLQQAIPFTKQHKKAQLDYHTLYFYQVLTLDKGTTAGLLVHDQNDIGTLGSLPRFINRDLLIQWAKQTASPRNQLVDSLINVLPDNSACEITTEIKASIAEVIRQHYQIYPL